MLEPDLQFAQLLAGFERTAIFLLTDEGKVSSWNAGPCPPRGVGAVRIPMAGGWGGSRASKHTGDDPAMSLTPQRILVVDDSRDGANSLAMVLTMLGAETEVAYDGPAAIAAIRARRPSAVLLDLGMPGMDGYEVAAEIRKDPALADVKLIALTGWGSEEERRKSREAGFSDHWVKPVDPARLRVLLGAAE